MQPLPAPLPVYSAESLARLEPRELIGLITGDEDRVPRNVIDECARRGEEMVLALEHLCGDDRTSTGEESHGEWWLPLHAVYILGLIASQEAGLLIVRLVRRMTLEGDGDLRDWLTGYWPALFRNKPESALDAVRELCLDRALHWYARIQGMEVVTAAAHTRGGAAQEAALDWLAGIAADPQEEFDLRVAIGLGLLDFPRARHRALLEELAAMQTGPGKYFSTKDVTTAFAKGEDKPGWLRFDDPWKFYSPAQIEHRQERWAEEDAAADAEDAADEDLLPEDAEAPYVRANPKVGRNDRCPCGSGKKYKHCCLTTGADAHADARTAAAPATAASGPDDPVWTRLNRFNDGFALRMLRFTDEVFGKAALAEAWDEFTLREDVPFDAGSPHMQVFMPWFFHDWLPKEEATRIRKSAPRGETVVGAWLKREGARIDPLERRYLEACLAAPFSFHEILACRPGSGFRLRCILTGEEREVAERSGSRAAKQGDIMFAKVVPIDHLALIDGCAPAPIPSIDRAPIIALRRKLQDAGVALTPAALREHVLDLFETYHPLIERVLNPRLPELQNTDGDALSFHRILYDIDAPQTAFDALKGLALDATEEELLADAARDSRGALSKVEFGWLKKGNAKHQQWNNTVLGQIMIDGGTLTVEVNSRRRADQFRGLALQLLEGRARYRSTVVESTQAMLERSRNKQHDPDEEARRARTVELNARPEVQALLAQQLAGHFATWPETSLPILGGRTPLDAVRHADGREMVEALVADVERHLTERFPGSHETIVARLRQRLGLAG